MPIEKILFPTKFRELSFHSLNSLLVLKEVGLREIIFCHVISREDVGFVPFGGYLKEEEEKLREEARIRFEDWQKSISNKGVDSKIEILVGEPIHQILHVADKENVDLIIVGQKKKKEIGSLFAGSVTLQIITRSKVPTLVSKYMVEYETKGEILTKVNDQIFETPMLIADWSEQSKRALDFLISIKNIVRKSFVFHGIDVKISKKYDKEQLLRIERESTDKLNDYCEKLKSKGIDTEPHLGAGDILEEALRISRERQASVIIIGTSGRGRLNEIIHGSLSHQLAKISELPTLLVP